MFSIFASTLKNPRRSFQILSRSHHRRSSIKFAWEKPNADYVKLNFDGTSRGKSCNASIGGVWRNHEGEFLLGYAEPIGRATSLAAELVATKRGLELGLENGWSHVWIEGDAMIVVDFFMDRMRFKSEEVAGHVKDIGLLMPQLKHCMISHIYREGNRVADELANMGLKLTKPQIWRDVPPHEVIKFVDEDAEGTGKSRLKTKIKGIIECSVDEFFGRNHSSYGELPKGFASAALDHVFDILEANYDHHSSWVPIYAIIRRFTAFIRLWFLVHYAYNV
ncbi:hypothetical protein QJS10_CPB11g01049 [Acorus calamus]|uniref:RNase H type-1 domain-containing protein n=1 Tax=Acorus calamus TaxID=4465 RepID=A0AAV9DTF0_ACOCL|nr:hypothetical protein QJS10_CPB11g01049 [Acorus calamus]